MYDCLIVGTGPAGFSVALNLKIHHKNFLWFGSRDMSGKVQKAPGIDNYPGLAGVTGPELFASFDDHRRQMGIEITEKQVTNIMPAKNSYMVLADNEVYEARTLALCTGVVNAKPLKGEEEFLGRGVSYCAVCDGNFYKDKKIAVYASAKKYEHEVEFLADLAKEVEYFPAYPEPEVERENVRVSTDYPVGIGGDLKACEVTLKSGAVCEVDGVFILRNAVAPSVLLKKLAVDHGHIVVNRQQETNLPGCFAAGDCTGRPYQYAKAVGEGNVAAHGIIEYLDT
ncbi:MAG: NAD(P)/FAD-dependent oxidoreductase [Muribaculaceae bacterium]|nr:NAD(P)/FAD-dependent oxidoreductase [Muribaculaceae bacterium]MCM1492518.1 NAD(P)/FAD-dependent oxidoreductase [Muribaculaceae bacterium]